MTLTTTLAPKARALTASAIRDWLDRGDTESIRVALSAQHAADLANIPGAFEMREIARLPALPPLRLQAETFHYFDVDLQLALADALDRRALTAIVAAMSHDERADLFASLSEDSRAVLLPGRAKAERDDMLKLAAYEEGAVGSVMTSDYATLSPKLTAPEAVEHLRTAAADAETIYSAYVLNAERRLVGAVRLRDLILARPGQTVGELMRTDPPHIRAGAPREEAVALIAKHDLLALPVINGGDKMVGGPRCNRDRRPAPPARRHGRAQRRRAADAGHPRSCRRSSRRARRRSRRKRRPAARGVQAPGAPAQGAGADREPRHRLPPPEPEGRGLCGCTLFGKHDLRSFGGVFDRTCVRPLSVAFDDATGGSCCSEGWIHIGSERVPGA